MRTAHTHTAHFHIETRQHELLGLDLGEGMPRRALLLGFTLCLGWTGTLLLAFGLPDRTTFTLYCVPPLLVAALGTQRSRRNDRRWNITYWTLTLRYLTAGHRPILCAGRLDADRAEWIPRSERWGATADLLRREPARRRHQERSEGREPTAVSGPPVLLAARPRLYAPDAIARARGLGRVGRRRGAGALGKASPAGEGARV
ncbi:hypothetical protein [Streptomyces sp. NPDC089919]|uniref:hypothetical protein n=1 Tax=Streptomyces sp. NPDC089919 TaxID=3155188 RepID=UPI00343197F4